MTMIVLRVALALACCIAGLAWGAYVGWHHGFAAFFGIACGGCYVGAFIAPAAEETHAVIALLHAKD